jgi:hypothetical protein
MNRALWMKIIQPTAASRTEEFLNWRFTLTPTPNPSPQGGGGLHLRSMLRWMVIVIAVCAATPSPSQCNQYTGEYDESNPETYDESDIEDAVAVAISDGFEICVKFSEVTKRLACYDKAMTEFGNKIEGITP